MKLNAYVWSLFGGMSLLCLVSACAPSRGSQGEAASIPPERLGEILEQMHVADAWVDQEGGPLYARNSMRDDLYDEILALYDLDRGTFYQNYQYYMNHPEQLDSIYAGLIRKMEVELDSLRARQNRQLNAKKEQLDSLDPSAPDTIQSPVDTGQIKPTPKPLRKFKMPKSASKDSTKF